MHETNEKMKVLVTGTAGFVGFHMVKRLLSEGYEVVGLDNLNAYYPVKLKIDRLSAAGIQLPEGPWDQGSEWISQINDRYRFVYGDLSDKALVMSVFERHGFDIVINLAAQAGVRYSLVNPDAYIQSNIEGFFNILEACRNYPVQHLLYASSSSVYGNADKTPFCEDDQTDAAVSLYAATKKSNELMAHTYSHLFRIPSTGLRFFTVYGPWGRPDMAYYSFSEAIQAGKPITLFDGGDLYRDFTYVDDIVESVFRLIDKPPVDEGTNVPYRVLNLGNSSPVHMKEFIGILENVLEQRAEVISKPRETTDVYITYADTSKLEELTGFSPETDIRDGLARFAAWFRNYKPQ
jgi:UDP-glucuronate 4-epimerase